MVEGLESWLEYTPHLEDMELSSPLDCVREMKFSSSLDNTGKMRKKREPARRIWAVFVVMLRAMRRRARKLVSARAQM